MTLIRLESWEYAFAFAAKSGGNTSLRSVFLLGVLAALLLTACSSGPQPMQVSMQASEFRFEPSTIEVMAGQQLTVMMQNMGTVEHDFVIQEIPIEATSAESATAEPGMAGHTMEGTGMEPAVHMRALAGMTVSVTFTPTKPGTYEFYCAVAGHKEAGMVGTLVVRER
jgi:uncharacterized cupredoxin-like copper-binding protein